MRDPETQPALHVHRDHASVFAREVTRLERKADQLSFLRLGLFLAAAVLGTAGFSQGAAGVLGLAALLAIAFAVAVVVHGRVVQRQHRADLRRQVHQRHVRRLTGEWSDLPSRGEHLVEATHPYARDIDLVGAGSLFQRIDTTHTRQGEQTLARWLAAHAEPLVVRARQAAVGELAAQVDLRRELEVAALASDAERLDPGKFERVLELPSLFEGRPILRLASLVLPALTLGVIVGGQLELWHASLWLAPVLVQLGILRRTRDHVRRLLDGMDARSTSIESIAQMLAQIEGAGFQSERLQSLKRCLEVQGQTPSRQLRRLRRWLGWSELRHQPLVHLVVNPLVLWDLHVVRGLEHWLQAVGRFTPVWFEALGEIEALAALSTLCEEPGTTFPDICDDESFHAEGLAHPLLQADKRVPNDVALPGVHGALVVTGSNMAGKSTLLRAVGLNIALALAGAPVCAARMRVPVVRLRASMRVDDSLQAGASYFHAELTKLRTVIEGAELQPCIFFLLDELLRGTNARARHLGAWAILQHLLERGAMGLVATHDTALARLAEQHTDRLENVHFTDTMVDGHMAFDYRLRPGIVRGSNALRLLTLAGIQLPDDADVELAMQSEILDSSGSAEAG